MGDVVARDINMFGHSDVVIICKFPLQVFLVFDEFNSILIDNKWTLNGGIYSKNMIAL